MRAFVRSRIYRKILCLIVLVGSDLLTLLAAFAAAFFLRISVLPLIFSRLPVFLRLGQYLNRDFLPCALILVGIFFLKRLYSRRMSFWEECQHLFRALGLTFVLLTALVFVGHSYRFYSRSAIIFRGLDRLSRVPHVEGRNQVSSGQAPPLG